MPSTMSDAEIAEDRYEQIHGDVMHWSYGAMHPDGPFHNDSLHEEARSFEAAADALDTLIGEADSEEIARAEGHPAHDALVQEWEAFAERVQTLAAERPYKPISLAGPDGWTYWLAEIEH